MPEPRLSVGSVCRILGTLWLWSLFGSLLLESTCFAGEPPPFYSAGCAILTVLCIVSSILLVGLFLFMQAGRRTWANALAASRQTMARWFAAVAAGFLGGDAAYLVNHLFPGRWTFRDNLLPGLLLFGVVGMLTGTIALAFPLNLRKTAILAFLFSVAFSLLIIVSNFR